MASLDFTPRRGNVLPIRQRVNEIGGRDDAAGSVADLPHKGCAGPLRAVDQPGDRRGGASELLGESGGSNIVRFEIGVQRMHAATLPNRQPNVKGELACRVIDVSTFRLQPWGMPSKKPAAIPPNRIGLLRKRKGITQQQIADELGVGLSAVSKIENSVSRLMPEHILPLARLLDIHPGELFAPLPGREDPRIEEAAAIIGKASDETVRLWLDGGHAMTGQQPASPKPSRKKA